MGREANIEREVDVSFKPHNATANTPCPSNATAENLSRVAMGVGTLGLWRSRNRTAGRGGEGFAPRWRLAASNFDRQAAC